MFAQRRTSRAPNRVSLQRALSKLGVCSRSRAASIIREGRVALNGTVCTNPWTWIDIVQTKIEVDGQRVQQKGFQYILFHKPVNVITTSSDERGRTTIYDVLPMQYQNLKPVGRLDKDTSGLLLLTNDHQLAELITNPQSHVEKVYEVETNGSISQEQLQKLREGVEIFLNGKEYLAVPRKVSRVGRTTLLLVLDEGKNRQVRRMMEAVGATVKSLKRIAIGTLHLGAMKPGEYREVTKEDILRALGNI